MAHLLGDVLVRLGVASRLAIDFVLELANALLQLLNNLLATLQCRLFGLVQAILQVLRLILFVISL